MTTAIGLGQLAGLERSCALASPGDWIRSAPDGEGIERIEAFFSGHAYDTHRHDTYAIGYTISGVQSFDHRGAQRDSTPGDLIVLHPDELHNGRAGIESGFRYRMAYIEPGQIMTALARRASAIPFIGNAVCRDGSLMRALVGLLGDVEHALEPLERDAAVGALAEALLRLDPSCALDGAETPAMRACERARDFLSESRDEAIDSTMLESVTGLDRYALARQFRRRYGTSPHYYLVMRRLERARLLIRRGEALAEAAAASGFADQSHMTRHFRRAYGQSPGRWRAMQVGGVPEAA
ncbi:AraC family transcriptional regulator [Bosea sp. Root483D1]|uniref:AraC family transcriptional regulator n=1 Tax=Bosea sp. Root483D1 TaxID=1736544 RepID=UPI00070BE13E|nr:AraC family transcriptional regulator [Bosea sp. Root483D1]KRE16259.1 AraC family transcriptional regulator [Bosea sp. Root483D1]